ncbi:hypothetical protein ACFFRR_000866 [Megaselia abdita]
MERRLLVWVSVLLSSFNFAFGADNVGLGSTFYTTKGNLAVVIDQDYVASLQVNILRDVKKIVEDTVRENLLRPTVVGIEVKYFPWISVTLKRDFLAAIIVANCEDTWNMYKQTSKNDILLIALTDINCPRLPVEALMIPIVEKGKEIPQIIMDLRVQNIIKWKSSALIFDSYLSDRSTDIIKALSTRTSDGISSQFQPMSIYLHNVNATKTGTQKTDSPYENIFRPYTKIKYNQFLVFSSQIQEVISVAKKLNLLDTFNQWLFFIPPTKEISDINSLTEGIVEGANIAFAFNSTSQGSCNQTILCSIEEVVYGFVKGFDKIMTEENSLYGMVSDEEWEALKLNKKEKQMGILNVILGVMSKSNKCTNCLQWSFKSVITWGQMFKQIPTVDAKPIKFNEINVGVWNPIFGIISEDVLFPHIEHRFRNATLKLLTYNNPPWQTIKKLEGGNDTQSSFTYSGIILNIMEELSQRLNFTIDYEVLPTDRNISDLALGSTYNIHPKAHSILSSESNEYFLGAVAVTIDDQENKVFLYTNPISIQKYAFITKKPEEVSRIYLFMAPFTFNAWAFLLFAMLSTAPILCFLTRWAPLENLRVRGLTTINNCLWYTCGALLQQGGQYLPKADSGRLLVGIWWIGVIVLVTTYSGNLVAFLTFPKFEKAENSLWDVLKLSSPIIYGLPNNSFFEIYAKVSGRQDFKEYVERATIYDTLFLKDVQEIQHGKRVNVDWKINLQHIIQREFDNTKECNFMLGREEFVEEQIGLIVPAGSPYLPIVNDEIKKLSEMGLIQRWHRIHMPDVHKCSGRSMAQHVTNHKVNLTDMQGCFVVLFLGTIVGLAAILLEMSFHNWNAKRIKKIVMN